MVMIVTAFFKLIRWPNLLIIALAQYAVRFFVIEFLSIPHALDHLEYFYGVLCSISLAAGGYVINDINDIDADAINKPERITVGNQISHKAAWAIYMVFNGLAIVSGYLVSVASGLGNLWLIPVIAIALLYLYSVDFKRRVLLGNILVSLLTGLPIFFIALFDILPAVNPENQDVARPAVWVIIGYAIFAFYTNLIREIVKDAEDIAGDKRQGHKTLAVLLGAEQVRYIILILSVILLVFTGYFNVFLFNSDLISSFYLLLAVNLPLIYFLWSIYKAERSKHFKKASTLIKMVMITGILSMAVFSFSIKMTM